MSSGLYEPSLERGSCGVVAVADVQGRRSRGIVDLALRAVRRLAHRGGCGCDSESGDGAGILLQIPYSFFLNRGIRLPPPGGFGVGMVFLPTAEPQRDYCRARLEAAAAREGLKVLGWRDVPVRADLLGEIARSSRPHVAQVFFAGEGPDLEVRLWSARKRAENELRDSDLPQKSLFGVPSLSSRTMVYKGMLKAGQLEGFYPDLQEPDLESALALAHSRFSTNTFPCWNLAQPFRMIAHNGEINTIRGNAFWTRAREAMMDPGLVPYFPILTPGGSDTCCLDNLLEFLTIQGRSLPHALMMAIPEPWQNDEAMSPARRAFYEFHASLIEPWDGPALVAFTDGIRIGAALDRNGLRPARTLVTRDGRAMLASEAGLFDVPPSNVARKGRLEPGRIFLVDTHERRLVSDDEVKERVCSDRPYADWLRRNLTALDDLDEAPSAGLDEADLSRYHAAFGYTEEEIRCVIRPMSRDGEEPVGSMGVDTPLAALSDRPRLLYDYFKQMFAQVTNPPIDSTREQRVMSLESTIGPERDLLRPAPESCRQIKLTRPLLTDEEFANLGRLNAATLEMTFRVDESLSAAMDGLCARAEEAVRRGSDLILLTDRGADDRHPPIPALLATAGVHHHLIRAGLRMRAGIVVETGEAREVHHFCLLLGYGAGAINPYLALATLRALPERPSEAEERYLQAVDKAILKVMAKMGISTLQSYRGAQIFEAIGLDRQVVDQFFTGTPCAIGGVGLDILAREVVRRREGMIQGRYQWRAGGEPHLFNPETIGLLQHATRSADYKLFREYTRRVDDRSRNLCTLRGLLDPAPADVPIPLEEVEPASAIVRRFATGAMSFGSIGKEAHETLAIAMNRLGGRSNTGEGGEDPARYVPVPRGDSTNSAIKQVASARFGVTAEYLANAEELQIKMAQGAKPGEGGQLPGHKVDAVIARLRHSTPGVGLISPPPHHDIYSIEDLAQLIFDLKNANPRARVSVKLVAEAGVGIVAAGVAKARADVVLISGHDGGTGASPLSSLQHAGAPWELGLAETQQVLAANGLRGRIVVQTDGKLMTGRDVVIAALLGAEEFGFATTPLVVLGCTMMRVCHLNTCPVGVATQDPELRKRFAGAPEHLISFFTFLAEEVREWMSRLGFRTMDEMIGRVDRLVPRPIPDHWKARGIDLSPILKCPVPSAARRRTRGQDHGLQEVLDRSLIGICRPALEERRAVSASLPISNADRAVGAMLSGEVTRRFGGSGLAADTIRLAFKGSAGQSFGAFLTWGITLELEGEANDYVGKGLSGGRIVVVPPAESAEGEILIGNVALYGATGGEAFIRGAAGERFAVRNSGAAAVVEGVGDHGCEYMTGGRVVVLGRTGRNFAAGMSGGIAYVLDPGPEFDSRCNRDMVDLERCDAGDGETIRTLLESHLRATDSAAARRALQEWPGILGSFVKILPRDYRRAVARSAHELQGAIHG
jgi:glutamate synthase domain-containing protein 2/glutamate synthase domain-containing protein 1/glutamate synthase domain-containing protein 3